MTSPRKRLALIHATRLAIEPVELAASALWPEVETVSLLDESLEVDRERSDRLTDDLAARVLALAKHAEAFGADGILFTCSAFGKAVEAANRALAVPVMKPNEAMFLNALSRGDRIAMIYTFAPAAAGMEAEFNELAASLGNAAEMTSVLCEGALDAKRSGDHKSHDRLIADCGAGLVGYDVILLAQFSMASAAPALRSRTAVPVETSPEAAIREMRRRVDGEDPGADPCSSV